MSFPRRTEPRDDGGNNYNAQDGDEYDRFMTFHNTRHIGNEYKVVIYVDNVDETVSEDELKLLLRQMAPIQGLKIRRRADHVCNVSYGLAYPRDAVEIMKLDGIFLHNRKLKLVMLVIDTYGKPFV